MTVFAITLSALIGALCLLNILLTVGVIRRLREHTELVEQLRSSASGPPGPIMLPPGERVGDFSAATVDGAPVSRDTLKQGETLVGVFSPGCSACAVQLPLFTELAGSFPGGRDRVLAVVVGDADEAAEEVRALAPVARVVRESHSDSAVARALGVNGFPAMARADTDGRILASGYSVEAVEALAGV